jgi:hypothetical protein
MLKKHPLMRRGIKDLFWSERRGSNPRPRPWQGRALPTELLSLIVAAKVNKKSELQKIKFLFENMQYYGITFFIT